jgi:hypothetical protein
LYKFNISYKFNINIEKVVKLNSKGNIGFTIHYYNIGGLGIVIGIIKYIKDIIKFL